LLETTSFVITQLLNGFAYAMLLFILSVGLSLIFGMMNVLNLTHGSFYMMGAYVGLSLHRITGSFWLSLPVAFFALATLGGLIERFLLRPFYHRGQLDQVLLTFGLSLIFMDGVKWVWGADIHSLTPPHLFAGSVAMGDNLFPAYRLFLCFFGLFLALVLYLVLERTRMGALVRAGASDHQMVNALGINIPRVFTLSFAFGSGLAGLSGVIAGPFLGLYPGMDFEILVLTLIVVVVGGMGSLSGSFWGSILIGVSETLGKVLFPDLSLVLIFLVMAGVLLLKPGGLLGDGDEKR
jgi:branched-subunit amino acid ABC-type transport system permease component